MALPTACQTPGAQFHTHIDLHSVEVKVELPRELVPLALTSYEAEQLEANLHNAVELVLAPYFRRA